MGTKKEIRKRILAKRDALKPAERFRSEALVTDRILEHQWYHKAEYILLFASYGSEISTDEILKDALKSDKKVYMPKVEGENMEFYRISAKEDLVAGYKGILEPDGTSEKFVYEQCQRETTYDSLELATARDFVSVLMIMPGAAFDIKRNRIGYGKGFYDKYLADKPDLQTIAIGFDCQMVEYIEADDNDIKPMQVICL
ncbi:MAG: 5-formyltetrahydrofolate cyclo-ligase [Lachnospiraceae bacterium]|nr:5-formyltetrahydrofolate cyclo-ligase [Lachnospiraceae bacterium]MBQ7781303.1 5-formyltetrahydrofolate cyclo-ligase [Lachnospiraceae bacterium]